MSDRSIAAWFLVLALPAAALPARAADPPKIPPPVLEKPAVPPEEEPPPPPQDHALGAEDLLDISVFEIPD